MHPRTDYPLCVIDEPISAVAARVGASEQSWIEPGLGRARGFSVLQPTGLSLRAEDLLERPSHCPPGFTVYVEAERLASDGVEATLQTILSAFGSKHSSVSWIQPLQGSAVAALIGRTTSTNPGDA
jgi:hypothetical protein